MISRWEYYEQLETSTNIELIRLLTTLFHKQPERTYSMEVQTLQRKTCRRLSETLQDSANLNLTLPRPLPNPGVWGVSDLSLSCLGNPLPRPE